MAILVQMLSFRDKKKTERDFKLTIFAAAPYEIQW